jgi:hypothetical protein
MSFDEDHIKEMFMGDMRSEGGAGQARTSGSARQSYTVSFDGSVEEEESEVSCMV